MHVDCSCPEPEARPVVGRDGSLTRRAQQKYELDEAERERETERDDFRGDPDIALRVRNSVWA